MSAIKLLSFPGKIKRPEIICINVILFASIFMHVNHPILLPISNNLGFPVISITLVSTLIIFRHNIPKLLRLHAESLALLLIFYIWMWMGVLFTEYPATVIKFAFKYSVYFLIFLTFLLLLEKDKKPLGIFDVHVSLVSLFSLLATFGLIEYFDKNFIIFTWIRPNNFNTYGHVWSLMQYHNPFGILMALGVVLTLLLRKTGKISLLLFGLLSSLFLTNMMLANSRNSVFSLVVSLVLCIYPFRLIKFRKSQTLAFILALLVGISAISLVNESLPGPLGRLSRTSQSIPSEFATLIEYVKGDKAIEENLPNRIKILVAASEEFVKKPFTGIGVQTFAENIIQNTRFNDPPGIQKGVNPHNLFVTIMLEMGVFGLILILLILQSIISLKTLKNPFIGLPVSFVFTSQVFDYFIHDLTVVTVMLMLLAIAARKSLQNEVV